MALRVIFRAVCRAFSALCGSLLREWIAYLWAEEREHLPCGGRSLLVCSGYEGYSVLRLWSMESLTSLVRFSKAGMMSSSRLVMIPLFKRSRKASRSAVESVRD